MESAGENTARQRENERWWGSPNMPVPLVSPAFQGISKNIILLCFTLFILAQIGFLTLSRKEFWPIHFLLWRLHIYNHLNIKQIQKISRRMRVNRILRLKEACPQPIHFLITCYIHRTNFMGAIYYNLMFFSVQSDSVNHGLCAGSWTGENEGWGVRRQDTTKEPAQS